MRVVIGETARSGRRVRAFADAGPGEVGLIVDSYGLVAVVLDRRSAAEELGLDAGSAVRLEPFDDDGADAGPWHAPSPAPSGCPAAQEPMRPGTTIVLAALLVLIFGAALLQFVFLARDSTCAQLCAP